jgi:hypothetical protein
MKVHKEAKEVKERGLKKSDGLKVSKMRIG